MVDPFSEWLTRKHNLLKTRFKEEKRIPTFFDLAL